MNPIYIEQKLKEFLLEDLGPLPVYGGASVRFRIESQESGVVCGTRLVVQMLECLAPLEFERADIDGMTMEEGRSVLKAKMDGEALRHGIRTALNLLQHLSGIATKTRELVKMLEGTECRLLDTRKTTPGLRAFEKYAHRIGGGVNHRFGRFDGVMVKKEDVAFADGLKNAISHACAFAPHLVAVEVEVEEVEELEIVAQYDRVRHVLLDNMSPDEVREAVERYGRRFTLEASGVTEETLRDYAETGVPFISTSATILRARPVKFHLVMD